MDRFQGRVVLVTGGSSGIGFATAKAFLEEGASVAILARSAGRLQKAAQDLRAFGEVVALRGDVSKPTDARRFVSEATRRLGPADVLVNNAGVYLNKPLHKVTEGEYDRVIDINLKGAFLCSKYVLPGMMRRKRGAIVNVASNAAFVGEVGASVYCASKGGMVLLTQAMALDYAKFGIRVNAICPGEVETPMLWREAEASGLGKRYYEQIFAPIPMRRAGTPEEVAQAVLFLASDAASYMTGAAVALDGGVTAQ